MRQSEQTPGRTRQQVREHAREQATDRGVSAVEVVLLAPLIIFFILLLVAFGQQVTGRSAVDGAARDAARAGSLERDRESALRAADRVAKAQLNDICVRSSVRVTSVGSAHEPGGLYTVQVSCRVRALDILGVPAAARLTGQSTSPIDPYRRAG